MKNLIIILLTIISTTAFGQKQKSKYQEINFKVSGVCEMCEDRIEKVLDSPGIRVAEWDLDTHNCKVIFNTTKTTELAIHKLVAGAGHDTAKVKASKESYDNLHGCCKYRTDDNH